ncbi:MAG: DUF3048 domain-containing protein [Dethiobacter sp.]|nr:DUF3048 domain-containing protein [Dethiobacter sp.]
MNARRCFLTALTLVSVFLLLIAAGFYSTAYGNLDEARRNVEATREQIAELEKVIKALEDSIKVRVTRIEELEKEFSDTETWLERAREELERTEFMLKERSSVFADRVRSAYIKGGLSYLELLLGAESLGDLIVRAAYLTRILTGDAELIVFIRAEQASIVAQRTAMEEQHQRLRDLLGQREGEQRNLEDQRREMDTLLAAAKTRLASELAKITPQAERKPVYAVAIDNVAQARPQHGLSKASIVYEYEVEGRTTRYLALFAALPNKVGPVRSARSHSAMLALENKTNFIYASAGTDVLAMIREWGVNSTNALTYSTSSIYRDSARRAPHNLYVNLSTLGVMAPSQEVVIRPAFLSRNGTSATSITIQYTASYIVRYEYVRDKGSYRRYINNQLQRDATGEEILARNIIIQYTRYRTDLRLRPTPDLIGEGVIDYYAQGEHFTGTWKKESRESPTRFYYQDGQEIERVYGQTWIHINRDR